MSDEGTNHLSALWVASTLHPERRMAQPTLAALLHRLRREQHISSVPAGAHALVDMPALGSVRGIARIEGSDGSAVGVARVGRTSFVGSRLTDDSLDEVDVALDEATGKLSIVLAHLEESPPTPGGDAA